MDSTKEKRVIRRVLRHKHSKEYFRTDGWTSHVEEAHTFQDALEAAEVCAIYGLSGVEIVLRVKGATSDLYCVDVR